MVRVHYRNNRSSKNINENLILATSPTLPTTPISRISPTLSTLPILPLSLTISSSTSFPVLLL